MPQYDYDEFTRRQEEYEARIREENDSDTVGDKEAPKAIVFKKQDIEDDDMSW